MNQTLNSKSGPDWLKDSYERRRSRSVDLGMQSIDQLIQIGESITYTTITEKSKEIDPEGKGIHPNTIRSNEQIYEYYKQHSRTYKLRQNSKIRLNPTVTAKDLNLSKIKANRNLDNLSRKYMKLTKRELVERLILTEEYIVENNKKWVSNYFEAFK